jgi:hypothetical protein
LLLFFQINLDICVPLVVSQYICQIWRVWRVRENKVGECRRVWQVQANQVGKCRRVWRVRHISKKGHFGEYSNSLNSLASGHCLTVTQICYWSIWEFSNSISTYQQIYCTVDLEFSKKRRFFVTFQIYFSGWWYIFGNKVALWTF